MTRILTYRGPGRLLVGPADGMSRSLVLPRGVAVEVPAEDAERLLASSRARHLDAGPPPAPEPPSSSKTGPTEAADTQED